MLDSYLYYLFISFTVTLFLIPLGSRIIEKLDIIDKPNNRKIHTENILSGGGIIIFLSIAILFFVFQFFRESDYDFLYLSDPILQSFLIGFLILFVMGLFDDKFDLSPKLKFLIQVVACSLFLALSGQLFSFHYLSPVPAGKRLKNMFFREIFWDQTIVMFHRKVLFPANPRKNKKDIVSNEL